MAAHLARRRPAGQDRRASRPAGSGCGRRSAHRRAHLRRAGARGAGAAVGPQRDLLALAAARRAAPAPAAHRRRAASCRAARRRGRALRRRHEAGARRQRRRQPRRRARPERDRGAQRRDRMARRAARRAAARALRARPAPASSADAARARPQRAPAGRARHAASSCARWSSPHARSWPRWSGRVYPELGYTDLAAWRPWVDYPVNVRQGQGALRVWATLERGALKQRTADLALADVRASLADELSPLELASAAGARPGRALADGVEFSGRGLALVMERGPEIPQTDFQIVWRPQAGGALAASLVDLRGDAPTSSSRCRCRRSSPACSTSSRRAAGSPTRGWSGPARSTRRRSSRRARALHRPRAARARTTAGLQRPLRQPRGDAGPAASSRFPRRKARSSCRRSFPSRASRSIRSPASSTGSATRAGALTVRIASLTFANAHASGNLFGSYAWHGEGPGSVDLSAVLNRADARHTAQYLPHPGIMGERCATGWRTRSSPARRATCACACAATCASSRSPTRRADSSRSRRASRRACSTTRAAGRASTTSRASSFSSATAWRSPGAAARSSARGSPACASPCRTCGPGGHLLVSGQAEGPTAEFLKLRRRPRRCAERRATSSPTSEAAGRGKLRLKLDLPLAELQKTEGRRRLRVRRQRRDACFPRCRRSRARRGGSRSPNRASRCTTCAAGCSAARSLSPAARAPGPRPRDHRARRRLVRRDAAALRPSAAQAPLRQPRLHGDGARVRTAWRA